MSISENFTSVSDIAKGLNSKVFSAEEITRLYSKRIREIDDKLNAFITVTEDNALKTALDSDKARKNGDIVPKLSGIPFGRDKNHLRVRFFAGFHSAVRRFCG